MNDEELYEELVAVKGIGESCCHWCMALIPGCLQLDDTRSLQSAARSQRPYSIHAKVVFCNTAPC